MSYLSTTENVAFSSIPQNISDGSCATQYKIAVEGASGNCSGDVNMFINNSSDDEHTYDNYFHSKFKIDPNELYTFTDSDVIAGEITVSHTEDNYMISEATDVKNKLLALDSPNKELDIMQTLNNCEIKAKEKMVPNGHYTTHPKSVVIPYYKETKTFNTKVTKSKPPGQCTKEQSRTNSAIEIRRSSAHSPRGKSNASIPNANININHAKNTQCPKSMGSETFLDVFKREQNVHETQLTVKTETQDKPTLPPPTKIPPQTSKKSQSAKAQSAKARRGRGPTVHEARQRIHVNKRAIPIQNGSWHAPGDYVFDCSPLDVKKPTAFGQIESSSDDDNIPDFELGCGPVCVEESAAESRGARLALRHAALRRQVNRVEVALRLANDHRPNKALATIIKKQLNKQGSSCRLPTMTVNHLLAMRGEPAVLTSSDRKRLREYYGWSGGDSISRDSPTCAEDSCYEAPLPCGKYCLLHVTYSSEQRLYASCAAVFAGGTRCMRPLLPLQDQTPLCDEHAWKRDNYDKLTRDWRPRRVTVAPREVRIAPATTARRSKRRRRPPAQRPRPQPRPRQDAAAPTPIDNTPASSDINVCSNSSNYDSSEDTTVGVHSETEFVIAARNSHELAVGEVGQVPPDDILDPAVLSQIPDEAFTEFFNQAEGGAAPFVAGSELAAALEAVLDERGLDERVLDERALDTIADCVFTHSSKTQTAKKKVQVPASVAMEMSSSASS